MENRFYQTPGLNIERLARDLEDSFRGQGYQAQHFGGGESITVQLKQGGDLEALIGMQAALTVTLYSVPKGVMAVVGQQQWVDKAVTGAISLFIPPLWPLMVTTGAGVIRQSLLEGQVMGALDLIVRRQRPDANVGSIPPDVLEHMEQQATGSTPQQPRPRSAPTSTREQPRCPHCQEHYDEDDAYCSRCGKPLTPTKKRCTQCSAELKAEAVFCKKCGTSVA